MNLNDLQTEGYEELFNRIFTVSGLKVPAEILNNSYMFQYLLDEIKKKHGRTDHKDVQIAFELYANKYLPIEIKSTQLTYINFNRVMSAYNQKESGERPGVEEDWQPTEEEKQEITRNSLISEFATYLKRGWFMNGGNETYKSLAKLKAFDSFSEDMVNSIKSKAKKDYETTKLRNQNQYQAFVKSKGYDLEAAEGYHYVLMFFRQLESTGITMEGFLENHMH